MKKITKKLFGYFSAVLAIFAVTAFIGFWGVFRYFTWQHLENNIKARAAAIARQLEQFLDTPGPVHEQGQGRGAYLRFINDIAMADAYILDAQGNPFTYGKHGAAGNIPTDEIRAFSAQIFAEKSYQHVRKKTAGGTCILSAGMPVFKNGQAVIAVIIRDTADQNQESILPAVSILGCCLLLSLVLSGFFCAYLSKRFMRPIRQIAAATKELAGGNYQAKTHVHDKTELGELAEETDLLAGRLEAARRKSLELDQMQKNYISNISHELRTPVAVIRSSLEAVCDGIVTGEKAAEYERQMLAECISLQRLVNDMLELSRLQNNDFPIEKENMDILSALEDAVRAVRVLAREKSVCVSFEKEQAVCFMEGDYGRLRQMFIAALDNAIKYSPEGGRVTVTVQKQPEHFIISIQDQGCGIPKQDLEHLFSRFYRCRQNSAKGSGLGLAIIKSIADRHGIEVKIASVCQNGTEIMFAIPVDSNPDSSRH